MKSKCLYISNKIDIQSFSVVFKISEITCNFKQLSNYLYISYLVSQVCLHNIKYFKYLGFFSSCWKSLLEDQSLVLKCSNTWSKWPSKHGNSFTVLIKSKFGGWDHLERKLLRSQQRTGHYRHLSTIWCCSQDYSHYRPSSFRWLVSLPFAPAAQKTFFFLVILGWILGLFLLTVLYHVLFH